VAETNGRTRPLALIAFGGNALVPRGSDGSQADQLREAASFASVVADLSRDHRLLLVHGNGPQVGQLLIQVEAGRSQVPTFTLDACGAASQGLIGYFLETAIRTRFAELGLPNRVSVLLTLTEVDADDPAFDAPTKPIGPFYPAHVARQMQEFAGWRMVLQDQGWRRVVPSPNPIRVHGIEAIRELLDSGHVVIAGGGGGIPVVVRRGDGALAGVEAVIDKDRTSALLVREAGAEVFVILTNVDRVEKDYGTDRAAPIDRMNPAEARALLAEGQFPAGSMGPKIEAALDVVERTGRPALVCSMRVLAAALRGRGGTWLVP
jgi:carbamate kinase